jgi:hypothetical protein
LPGVECLAARGAHIAPPQAPTPSELERVPPQGELELQIRRRGRDMLYAIMKETYAWPVRDDAAPLETRGPIGSKNGFEAAKEYAEKLAAKFDHYGFESATRDAQR